MGMNVTNGVGVRIGGIIKIASLSAFVVFFIGFVIVVLVCLGCFRRRKRIRPFPVATGKELQESESNVSQASKRV